MAATNFTPISLYYSTTASTAPTAGNLVAGELAINTNDGVLYYKDSSGVVQSIASKAGNSGSFTNLAYTGTLTGGTGVVNLGSGQFYKDASGNVGIGTASPSYRLDVKATTAVTRIQSTTGTNEAYLNVNNTGGDLYVGRDNSAGSAFSGSAYAAVLYSSGAYPMEFFTNGSERMRIDSSGRVLVGLTSANTSGSNFQVSQGVTFPATQSASSDANTLDDYEEGTWTPNQGANLTVVGTFSSSGTYTKVGRLVTVRGVVQAVTSISCTSGGAITSNLPFISSNDTAGSSFINGLTTGNFIDASALTIYAIGAVSTSTAIYFSATYQTTT